MLKLLAHSVLLIFICIRSTTPLISVKSGHDSTIRRVKRSWTYPPTKIVEGYAEFPVLIAKIKSDNKNAKMYKLRGDGVGVDGSDKNAIFRIFEDTGVITQLREVDREVKDKYEVVATALDAMGNPVEEDTTLYITVIDRNDNKPVFIESTLTGSVPEANDASSPPFMFINVTDADIGMNGRKGVKFSIEPQSDRPESTPRFSIDEKTGRVSVVGKLDYETDSRVYFTVKAVDGGEGPGYESTATVTVNILDSNDHAPILDSTPPKSVSELFPVNVNLYEITASDIDEKENKEVYFEILSGNTGETFTIESKPSDAGKSIGRIKLAKKLDFEDGETEFSLRIKAYNKLAENADSYTMASHTTVVIKVTDGNEPPELQNTPYDVVISEATEVPSLLSLPISARDRDFGGNQTIKFSITEDPESWFKINPVTGKLTATSKLDREAPKVIDSLYTLKIRASDNYPGNPASVNGQVRIFIEDVNDNPPLPVLPEKSLSVTICDKPRNKSVLLIEASDPDDTNNGPPFDFKFDSSVSRSRWGFAQESPISAFAQTYVKNFDLSSFESTLKLPFTISDRGSPMQTGTATLTVKICQCEEDDIEPTCKGMLDKAGFPLPVIIVIIVVVLLLIILMGAIAYRRKGDAEILKEPFFDDEDDVRENIQVYQEEGGEEDQQAYDLSALQAPLLNDPHGALRVEKPLQQPTYSRMPRDIPDDIGDYIGEAKDQVDNDPSAPPFDSLLVFDYEGLGSDAGSLSSINTATTDGSVDYDYLNDWGPRFKKLSDMYNGGYDSE